MVGVGFGGVGGPVVAGEKNQNFCPFSGPADYIDEPAMLFHDSKHGCQAEARALADLLGSEKRFEDAIDRRGVHPNARVGYREQHIAPWPYVVGIKAAVVFVDVDVLGLDDESSAFRHSISRIQTEVHKHLVNLDRVRQRDAKVRCRAETDLYVLSNHSSQEACSFLDQIVEVDPSRLQDLPSSERQELGSQPRSPLSLVANLLETFLETRTRLSVLILQFSPA